jgi:hypothetical protein
MSGTTRDQERAVKRGEGSEDWGRGGIYAKYAAAMGHELPGPAEPVPEGYPRQPGFRRQD